MTLHEAIKKLVAQFGESIVTEVRLANLLADLNGYQDYPAMKMVLKEFLKAGYGKKLFDIPVGGISKQVYKLQLNR